MFDVVQGLPLHVLVVHAVVVLIPLAAVGTIAVAAVPRWRRPYAPVVALLATAALAVIPVATRSGLALMRRVGPPDGAHQALGQQLFWYVLPLAVLLWLLVVVDRRERRRAPHQAVAPVGAARRGPVAAGEPAREGLTGTGYRPAARASRGVSTLVAVLALVAALAAGFQVYRVGDSGARSVWGGVAEGQSAPSTFQELGAAS
ncbi:DUF2231 domain-containing protein [Georgenia sp. AZ-5]|uniref:DUF2231 domain-containing protein n=1 Tax=Georgenia sp. AZ-5 TaxID=3367526 RepID=UPI0037546295